ncbi:hypothetical protein BGZ83_000510 [Gryganskiella cystojenkinii]|nr:hypothetical protein BGZ83_000510 [Gryganskiella cystojenkinii]
MPQLLESTRTYLKTSTKLGRRLSSYRDDSSASEASLAEATILPPSSTYQEATQHQRRPSSQKRLSALFTFDGWNNNSSSNNNRKSISYEDRALSSKVGPETQQEQPSGVEAVPRPSSEDLKKKKRKSSSSRTKSTGSDKMITIPSPTSTLDMPPLPLAHATPISQSLRNNHRSSRSYQLQRTTMCTEDEDQSVSRGRSLTVSVPTTVHASSSFYESDPSSEHGSVKQQQSQQSHAWRRQLLEESIMHSLQLGYGAPSPASPHPRSSTSTSSRHRSRSRSRSRSSLKRSALGRSRKVREQQAAKVSAEMSKDLPPCPAGPLQELVIVDRGLPQVLQGNKTVNSSNNTLGQKNSPYQLLLNPSSTNITHSFASFTLELDEHQVPHVMSASMVPNLFKIKVPTTTTSSSSVEATASRPRGRKESVSSILKFGGNNGSNYSPRVLTGRLGLPVDDESKENRIPASSTPVVTL